MDGPIVTARADPLGEALHLLHMDGAFYCRSELRAPWGITLPPLPGYLWFHVVTSGSLLLEAGDTVRTLAPGEVARAARRGPRPAQRARRAGARHPRARARARQRAVRDPAPRGRRRPHGPP